MEDRLQPPSEPDLRKGRSDDDLNKKVADERNAIVEVTIRSKKD
jgi:hypothetical protein